MSKPRAQGGLRFVFEVFECVLNNVLTAAPTFHPMPGPARNAAPMKKPAGLKRRTLAHWIYPAKNSITTNSPNANSGRGTLCHEGFTGGGGLSAFCCWVPCYFCGFVEI